MRGLLLATAMAALVVAGSAKAADPTVTPDKHQWDIAFGVTFTSDYVSRGATNTEGGAAVQPWAEVTLNDFFYAGYWGSNVSAAGTASWESDLSVGIRPVLGPVELDFGYVRYIYSDHVNWTDSGELYAKGSFSPFDPVTLGAAGYWDPENSTHYIEANASVDLPYNFAVSGAVGSTSAGATPWNVGASWSPQDWVTFDARYHSGAGYDKFVVSLSLSSSLKALGVIQ